MCDLNMFSEGLETENRKKIVVDKNKSIVCLVRNIILYISLSSAAFQRGDVT